LWQVGQSSIVGIALQFSQLKWPLRHWKMALGGLNSSMQ
jgi:hypothetical protein